MAKKSLSFLETIQEKYESYLKDDKDKDDIRSISTGSISLDYSTGVGGIPKGRYSELYGPESSGKTTLSLNVARHSINSGKKVLFIDAENGLTWDYVLRLIPQATPDNFIIIQPEFAEDAFILAEAGIRSNEFDLIVYDSIVALASKSAQEDDFEKANVASLSRLVSRFTGRNTYSIRQADTAFLIINQVRDKIGSYVPMLDTPGGHSLKHFLSLRISLKNDLSKDGKITMDDEPIGNYVKFTIQKNKLARPYRTSSFPLMYGTGIDLARDALFFCETLGIIQRSGAYFSFGDIRLGQGISNSLEFLNSNKEVLDKILEVAYNKMDRERTLYLDIEPVNLNDAVNIGEEQ